MRQVRDALYALGPGYFIDNPRAELPSVFQYNGYALFSNRLHFNSPADREAIEVLKGVFKNGDFTIVFQDRPFKKRENRQLSQHLQFLTKIVDNDSRRELFDHRIEDFLRYIELTDVFVGCYLLITSFYLPRRFYSVVTTRS